MNAEEKLPVNVIKQGPDSNGSRVLLKNQVLTARREADEIIYDARGKAESILGNAVKESEKIRDDAYREGLERSLAEFEQHLIEAREIRLNVLRDAERDLLTLSVRIAEKILGNELASNKKAILDIVSAALQNARQRESITVHVNPLDLGTVTDHGGKFLSSERTKILDFVADPSVTEGGCVIETEVGQIDARLETQFNVIERALLNRSEGGEPV